MNYLELKIPPPVVIAIIAAVMWAVAPAGSSLGLDDGWRIVFAASFVLAGAGFDLCCAIAFWRAKTTVNPMRPKNSSALVTSGAYRFSRNPMYVGQALMVIAWAIFLNSAWALAGLVAFVFYLNRFQILPEEGVLAARFGDDYKAYSKRVRRWL